MYIYYISFPGVNSTVANATLPARVMYSPEPEFADEREARDGSWRARIMHPGSELSVTLNHKFRQRRFSDFARHSWSSFSLAGENVGITWVKPPIYITTRAKAHRGCYSGLRDLFWTGTRVSTYGISRALFLSLSFPLFFFLFFLSLVVRNFANTI